MVAIVIFLWSVMSLYAVSSASFWMPFDQGFLRRFVCLVSCCSHIIVSTSDLLSTPSRCLFLVCYVWLVLISTFKFVMLQTLIVDHSLNVVLLTLVIFRLCLCLWWCGQHWRWILFCAVSEMTQEVADALRLFGFPRFRQGQETAIMRVLCGQFGPILLTACFSLWSPEHVMSDLRVVSVLDNFSYAWNDIGMTGILHSTDDSARGMVEKSPKWFPCSALTCVWLTVRNWKIWRNGKWQHCSQLQRCF